MEDLLEKLQSEVGLSAEQAAKSIETIKLYVIEKFPMLESAVENIFSSANSGS